MSRAAPVLSHAEAREVYDRIGSFQDSQAFYEDRAVEVLVRHGDFGSAREVFELGCGTGRFARGLLEARLPADARYRGVDLSPRMVALAQERLASWADRASVSLSEGGPPTGEPTASCDRFVSSYVLDLLSEPEIRAVLREAHRMLRPGGLLCLVSLSTGSGPVSRTVARTWGWLQARAPKVVGGCRPLDLRPFATRPDWEVLHDVPVVAFGVPSEALIARRP